MPVAQNNLLHLNYPFLSYSMPFDRKHFESVAEEYAHLCDKLNTKVHIAQIYGRRGELLAQAMNKVGTRSSGAGYSSMTIHAERAAMKALGDVSLLNGATLYVIRVGKHGDLLGSKPCCECKVHLESAMRKYGLKQVLYS